MTRPSVFFRATSLVGGLLALSGCAPQSASDSANLYPTKTVTLICPWSPGGGTDRLTRFMADQLQKELGQPFVVVNRTGGSGAVGHSAGALAPADGHTLTMATFELSTMHWMGISELTWENYAPILQMNADAAAIMVRSNSPWQTLDEFLVRHRRGWCLGPGSRRPAFGGRHSGRRIALDSK